MIRRPPRSTPLYSSAASDVYKRQDSASIGFSKVLSTWINTCAPATWSRYRSICALRAEAAGHATSRTLNSANVVLRGVNTWDNLRMRSSPTLMVVTVPSVRPFANAAIRVDLPLLFIPMIRASRFGCLLVVCHLSIPEVLTYFHLHIRTATAGIDSGWRGLFTPVSCSWRSYPIAVSYTHLRAHETKANLVCRLLLDKK